MSSASWSFAQKNRHISLGSLGPPTFPSKAQGRFYYLKDFTAAISGSMP
jgi:hypothetical protein